MRKVASLTVCSLVVLWPLLVPTPAVRADEQSGKQVFQLCAACHHERADATGPLLRDVLGRKAGSAPGFRYSGPMKRARLVWNADTLRSFLRDPQALVPGNRMPFPGLTDGKQIEDLISYLEQKP